MLDFASHQVVTARAAAVLHRNSARLCDLEFGMALYHPSHTLPARLNSISWVFNCQISLASLGLSQQKEYSWDLAAVANALPIPRTSFCLIRSYCFAAGFKIFQWSSPSGLTYLGHTPPNAPKVQKHSASCHVCLLGLAQKLSSPVGWFRNPVERRVCWHKRKAPWTAIVFERITNFYVIVRQNMQKLIINFHERSSPTW